MLLLLILIVLFGFSTQYRDGFQDDLSSDMDDQDMDDQSSDMDDQDSMDSNSMSSMSSLRRQLPPMVSRCVKDGLRDFDDS